MARFIGVTRPGHTIDVSALPKHAVEIVEVPAMAISSTDVRDRVKAHEPIWYLVPEGVVQHIRKYKLYAQREAPGKLDKGQSCREEKK